MNRALLVSVLVPGLALLGAANGRAGEASGRRAPMALGAQTTVPGTPTQLPPLDRTPVGGRVAVGTPLSPPALATDAINPENAGGLQLVGRPAPPAGASEGAQGFTIDGSVVLTNGDSTWTRSARDGGLAETIDAPGTAGIGFTPDGRYVLLVDGLGGIGFWDRQWRALARRHFGGRGIAEITFTADGTLLAAVRQERTLHVWDVATGALLREGGLGDGATIQPLTGRVASAVWYVDAPAEVLVRDLASWALLETLPFRQPGADFRLKALTWSPSGDTLVGLASDSYNILSPDTQTMYEWWSGNEPTLAARRSVGQWRGRAWRPDGKVLAIVEMRRPEPERAFVTTWDGIAFADVAIESARHVEGLSWSPDGRLLALGWEDWDTDVYQTVVWAPDARRVVMRIPGTTNPRFSPDGSRLVVSDKETGGIAFYGVPPLTAMPPALLPALRR